MCVNQCWVYAHLLCADVKSTGLVGEELPKVCVCVWRQTIEQVMHAKVSCTEVSVSRVKREGSHTDKAHTLCTGCLPLRRCYSMYVSFQIS